MSASWNYNYADLEEISLSSDIIGIIRIDEKISDFIKNNIPFTEYSATFVTPLYNINNGQNITILMTGCDNKDTHIEVLDDPLMEQGEEYLIFARQNDNGTYTILSGPQGRMKYDNGKLNSLQEVNENVRKYNACMSLGVKDMDADTICEEIKGYVKNK